MRVGKSMMLYERSIELSSIHTKFKRRLMNNGLTAEQADNSINIMSKGDFDQVQKDLKRHPQIVVIDEMTGKKHRFFSEDFAEEEHVENFLRLLAKDDKELYQYLTQYFHQGGFMHLSEFLISYYFAPNIRFETANRTATFTIAKDRSITFEEKFDIQNVSTGENTFEKNTKEPLATISLKSIIQKTPNNEVQHQYNDLNLKVNDKVATKFFNDPRGKFEKCLAWVKDMAKALLNNNDMKEEIKRRKISKRG